MCWFPQSTQIAAAAKPTLSCFMLPRVHTTLTFQCSLPSYQSQQLYLSVYTCTWIYTYIYIDICMYAYECTYIPAIHLIHTWKIERWEVQPIIYKFSGELLGSSPSSAHRYSSASRSSTRSSLAWRSHQRSTGSHQNLFVLNGIHSTLLSLSLSLYVYIYIYMYLI